MNSIHMPQTVGTERIILIPTKLCLIDESKEREELPYSPVKLITETPPDAHIWVDIVAPRATIEKAQLVQHVGSTFGPYIDCQGAKEGAVLFNSHSTHVAYPDHEATLGLAPVYECIVSASYFQQPRVLLGDRGIQTVRDAQAHIIGKLTEWSTRAGILVTVFQVPPAE